MNKPIHPAVAEHVMQENVRLRGLLSAAAKYIDTGDMRSLNMIEVRAALSQQAEPAEPAPVQDEREVAAVIGFYEDEREPRSLSWNVLPDGEHRLYTRPAQDERNGCDYAGCCNPAHPGTSLCLEHHSPKARAALPPVEQTELYTCTGRGGEYELIGRASTAGSLKVTGRFADEVIVYRDVATRALYCRTPGDFRLRMERAALARPEKEAGHE